MKYLLGLLAAMWMPSLVAAQQPRPHEPSQSVPLADACSSFEQPGICELLPLVSQFMVLSYATDNPEEGVRAFEGLGYQASYHTAAHSIFVRRPRLFLASQRASNRVYVIFPGTEDTFDWAQNAKFSAYQDVPNDGQLYLPPGHAGFRRGMLNISDSRILDGGEFGSRGLDCSRPEGELSRLTHHVCSHGVQRSPEDRIQLVLIGHSRGAGFIQIGMTAFHGLKWRNGQVARDPHWPYDVEALFAYAPPYAIYRQPGRVGRGGAGGHEVDQWSILEQNGLDRRAYMIIQDGDMVPTLWSPFNGRDIGYNQGRHFGTFIRITRDRRAFLERPGSWDLEWPHKSELYCRSIQTSLGGAHPCEIP